MGGLGRTPAQTSWSGGCILVPVLVLAGTRNQTAARAKPGQLDWTDVILELGQWGGQREGERVRGRGLVGRAGEERVLP